MGCAPSKRIPRIDHTSDDWSCIAIAVVITVIVVVVWGYQTRIVALTKSGTISMTPASTHLSQAGIRRLSAISCTRRHNRAAGLGLPDRAGRHATGANP